MAPLPAHSTARVKFKYTTCTRNHVLQVRYKAPNTIDDVATFFNALITEVGPLLYASTLIEVTAAAVLSDVFNPVIADWPIGWGSADGEPAETANMLDFVGRGVDGKKVRMCFFGCKSVRFAGKSRMPAASQANVNGAVTLLNSEEGTALNINGFQPVWNQYANIGENAYWRNHTR
jgi:hypothetical protein